MGNLSNWGKLRLREDSSKSGVSQSAIGPGSLALASPSFPCIQLCWAVVEAYLFWTPSSRDNLADLSCSRLPEMFPPGLELSLPLSSSVLGFYFHPFFFFFCMHDAGYRTQNLGQARQSLYL